MDSLRLLQLVPYWSDSGVLRAALVRPILAASIVIVIAARHAAGSDPAAAPIATDRPAATDSSVVVPPGSLQAGNGFAESVNQGQSTFDAPGTLLRFGMASKTELRLTAPDYFRQVGIGSGFGDLVVGIKQQLGPTPGGFDVSLVLSLSLPTGASVISSHGYDPFVQLPWSRAFSSNWTAAGMLSVYWPTEQGHRNVTGETTFLMDRQLTKTWDAFVEYAGDFPEQGGPRHLVHFGTAYKPTSHQQLDLHWVGPVFGRGGSLRRCRLLLSLASGPAVAVDGSDETIDRGRSAWNLGP